MDKEILIFVSMMLIFSSLASSKRKWLKKK